MNYYYATGVIFSIFSFIHLMLIREELIEIKELLKNKPK